MSANNQLIIYEKEPLVWTVKEVDADTGDSFKTEFEEYATLEDAVRACHSYMETEEVEYGYKIVLSPVSNDV